MDEVNLLLGISIPKQHKKVELEQCFTVCGLCYVGKGHFFLSVGGGSVNILGERGDIFTPPPNFFSINIR